MFRFRRAPFQTLGLAGLFLFAAASGAAHAASAAIYDLGSLGGGNTSPSAVNDSGQVVGQSETSGNALIGFIYTGIPGNGGSMTPINQLFIANDLNDSAQIVGLTGSSHGTYYSGGSANDLGSSFGPFAINNAGQIVGVGGSTQHAMAYTGAPGSGHTIDLNTLGGTTSFARAISQNGFIAGDSDTSNGNHDAFLYTGTPGSGAMADLGTLNGSTIAYAYGVNNSAQVVGESDGHAFLYSGTPGSGGHMSDLGTLGGTYSQAQTITDTGQIVGYSTLTGGSGNPIHAFLYTGTPGNDGHMIDLNAWLAANDPTDAINWTLDSADSISDTGWITGTGIDNGNAAAFLLNASSLVPEPSSLSFLTLSFLALFHRRRSAHDSEC